MIKSLDLTSNFRETQGIDEPVIHVCVCSHTHMYTHTYRDAVSKTQTLRNPTDQ